MNFLIYLDLVDRTTSTLVSDHISFRCSLENCITYLVGGYAPLSELITMPLKNVLQTSFTVSSLKEHNLIA